MHLIPYLIGWAALAVFAIACAARVATWLKMPMHVRWELYPVAHEGKRAHYGGSYLEESQWWTKPREVSMWGELKVMVPEILFLVAVRENNPKLWLRTFPFHFGLYLVAASTALMMLLGLLGAVAPDAAAALPAGLVQLLVVASGVGGLCLSIIGALGLLHRRLTELRDFSSPADIFNLIFFLVAFGVALGSALTVDRGMGLTSAYVGGLVTFNPAPLGAPLPALAAVLLSLLVAYIPLTHMSHFIGKYFAYHAIRWSDEPNLRGGKQEPVIQELLSRPLSWQAAHIGGNGKKTWAEVCTDKGLKEPS